MLFAALLLLLADPAPAIQMAQSLGISIEEAEARLRLVDRLAIFEMRARSDPDYAGAYLQHEPALQAVVMFRGDAAEKMNRYVGSDAGFTARAVERSLGDLDAARDAADKAFKSAGLVPAAIELDVEANRVAVFFVNPDPARALTLPDGVTIEAVEGDLPLKPQTAGAVTQFPQARNPGPGMRALISGTLFIRDGCIRIGKPEGDSHLVLWPATAQLALEGDTVIVTSGKGRLVVGDDVSLGGGAGIGPPPPGWLLAPVSEACPGPYWIASQSW